MVEYAKFIDIHVHAVRQHCVDVPLGPGGQRLNMYSEPEELIEIYDMLDISWDDRTGYPTGPVKNGRIPELMRKYPNLYCDISAGSGNNALARDMDHAGRFLTEFADRVLFGLDICTPANHIEKYGPDANGGRWVNPQGDTLRALLRTGRISCGTYRKVSRENAMGILGI